MVPEFKDNVVVLTGASAGIGKALALELAAEGAWLCLASRQREPLERLAEACEAAGGKTLVVPTDVAHEDQCRWLIEQAVAHFGRIDTLINNAGITHWCTFQEMEHIGFMKTIMEVNYYGAVYCTRFALPHLQQSRGRLVAVSSLSGLTGVPTRSLYAASKHAMMGFFDSLRIELMGSGVSVTTICPGFVSTEVRERAFGANGKPLGKSHVKEDRVMTAETCAKLMRKAIAARKRQLTMTAKGRLGRLLRIILPGVVDRIAKKTIERGE